MNEDKKISKIRYNDEDLADFDQMINEKLEESRKQLVDLNY